MCHDDISFVDAMKTNVHEGVRVVSAYEWLGQK